MYWDINDLKTKLVEITERIKNEKDEKALLTLRVDAETLNILINYISYPYINESENEYSANLIFRSNISQTGKFITENYKRVFDITREISHMGKLSADLVHNKKISNEEYFDLMDKFFKGFDSELSTLYRKMIDTNRIELSVNNNCFKGQGIAHHLSTYGTTYITSKHNGTIGTSSTIPHEVGHARQLDGETDIDTDINLLYSIFREAYPKFIEYVFCDYLKETKYCKCAFDREWSMLDELNIFLDTYYAYYSNIGNSEFIEHEFRFANGDSCGVDPFRDLYSNIYAMYFINMYRQDKSKCIKELNKFNSLVGKADDGEIISLYSNESLLNSIREVRRNYVRTYRRR